MKKFSFSSLDQYRKCPLAFKYRYVDKIKSTLPERINLVFGDAVHKSLEFAFKTSPDFPETEKVLEKFRELFPPKDKETEIFSQKGEKILRDYLSKNKPQDFETIDLEKMFSIIIDDFEITGKIDRVDILPDSTFEIIDYKTGKMASLLDLKKNPQLAIYQIAALEMWNPQKVSSSFIYLEYGGHKLDISHPKERLEEFRDSLKEQVKAIRGDKEFKPNPSGLCPYCDYENICPLTKFKYFKQEQLEIDLEQRKINIRETVEKFGSNFLSAKDLEKEQKELREIIATYAKNNKLERLEGENFSLYLGPSGEVKVKAKRK